MAFAARNLLKQTFCSIRYNLNRSRILTNSTLTTQTPEKQVTSPGDGSQLNPALNVAESGLMRAQSSIETMPIMLSREIQYPPLSRSAKVAWIESLAEIEAKNQGMIDLHPDIFATHPRLDILANNVYWQQTYRRISYAKTKTRAEVRGGGKKPWVQKGLGKARHGSIRSPLWIGGGVTHGPRGPKSYFYMEEFYKRVLGLRVALSVKFAQDDLHIVDSLEIPSEEPEYLEALAQKRFWGVSVLFVDNTDLMPRNISIASSGLKSFNLMPVYGLNVYSMLKHETLVLTVAAVNKLEERLLFHMHRQEFRSPKYKLQS